MKNWNELFENEFSKEYFLNILKVLDEDRNKYNVFPSKNDIFRTFELTSFDNVKCVILGQDPYHNSNQANGLAFSVNKGIKLPPSLQNIFKELSNDLGINIPISGDLSKWASEGVLLLNTVLTVRENEPNSHANIGWEIFTDKVIKSLNELNKPICFILWGNNAKNKIKLLTNPKHLILVGSHPSPLSSYRGFFGGKYFSKTNEFLISNKQLPIDWNLNY